MNPEPSPRPLRVVDYDQCPGLADVFDASGSPSGIVAGELKPADAALIVGAVNERDRLRDLVRRLSDSLQGIMDAADGKGEGVLDESLLREARAAIGKDAR